MDETKLNQFLEKAIVDMGASMSAALVLIGDKLGLYKTMAGAGGITPAELAQQTGTAERYVREWLNAQAAGGYVTYDPATQRYTLPDEQAFALAVEDSPAFLPGAFQIISAVLKDEAKIAEAFRTGKGVGWHEHDPGLFEGTERFFRPNYAAHNSTFLGFDYHPRSIEWAQRRAEEAGLADRVTFQVASAKEYPGDGYDLVAFFDCLHDMGDPVGAAAHVRTTLGKDGAWMIVEPFANDRVEENLNPVGRVFYSASTMICTPASLSQEVGLALGAQAGEKRLRDVVTAGGFTRFRRAAETPFNLVFEARP